MKTTLQLPDMLYRHLKMTAASEGRTLTDVIQECLRRGLAAVRKPVERKKSAYRPPLIKSKHPGALNLTSEMIENLLLDVPPELSRK